MEYVHHQSGTHPIHASSYKLPYSQESTVIVSGGGSYSYTCTTWYEIGADGRVAKATWRGDCSTAAVFLFGAELDYIYGSVFSVAPGSDADRFGLKPGDKVLAFHSRGDRYPFPSLPAGMRFGDTSCWGCDSADSLEVMRDNTPLTLYLLAGESLKWPLENSPEGG
jgi:hypothetical protein